MAELWLETGLPMLRGRSPVECAQSGDAGLRQAKHALDVLADAQKRLVAAIERGTSALGEEAIENWLTTPRSEDGADGVAGFIRQHPDQIGALERELSHLIWQRDEARRQKESRRAEIDARMAEPKKLIDQAMPHDPVAGAMLLRNAHPALGGKRPVEACETQQGFDAVVALLRKTGERAKRRRL